MEEELESIKKILALKTALELWRYYRTENYNRDLHKCIDEVKGFCDDEDEEDFWERH